jgi:hypothetical protein
MNPLPNTDLDQYVQTVLTLYLELPETPLRATPQDQMQARQLQQRGVPLMLIESALLLASLRRFLRPPGSLPLSPIRSFAYFQPVIEELLHNPVPDSYVEYLRHKMKPFAGEKISRQKQHPAKVQKTTDSDDR